MSFKHQRTGEIVRGYEKVWHCSDCARKKVDDLVAAVGDKPWDYFLTLTSKEFFRPPVNRVLGVKEQFNKFLDAVEYKYGRIEYLWAAGTTKKGQIHFHVLWRGPQPDKTWLSRKWHRLTGAYIVDIKPAWPGAVGYTFWNAARPIARAVSSAVLLASLGSWRLPG